MPYNKITKFIGFRHFASFEAKTVDALYNNIYVPNMSTDNKFANIELKILKDFRLKRYKFVKDKSRFDRSRKLKIQALDDNKLRIKGRFVDIVVTLDELKKVFHKGIWKVL